MAKLIGAAAFLVIVLGMGLWFYKRSGRRWSAGLTVMCIGVFVYSLAMIVFIGRAAICLPLFILAMALIWGGGCMHNPALLHALLHGDPPDDNGTADPGTDN